jgi:hypothetical protein
MFDVHILQLSLLGTKSPLGWHITPVNLVKFPVSSIFDVTFEDSIEDRVDWPSVALETPREEARGRSGL